MANTANKAQQFLLNNNCGDLILNDHRTTKPEDRIYASDIMMMFIESERGENVDTSKRQLTIPDVSNAKRTVCKNCNGKGYKYEMMYDREIDCKNCNGTGFLQTDC